MADPPKAKAPRTADRTGAVVWCGIVLLALVGIATIFADPILSVLSPPPTQPQGSL
jgi:hypothetical protein